MKDSSMGNSASVEYDREADVLYVRFARRAKVARTVGLDDVRLIDYSADHAVVGLEFIDASTGIDLHDVPFASQVEKLIGETGLDIPIFV